MQFTLKHLNPALSFRLTTWELGVDVDWMGDNWDVLIYFESIPTKVAMGYQCRLCLGEDVTVYPSREALWIAHDFECFLHWVNHTLLPVKWLAISGQQNEMTWAKLVEDPNQVNDTIYLPVWLSLE